MTVGDRIKTARINAGLSADELAEIIGKDRSTIYRYESKDIEKLPTSVLKPLCEALRVQPSYLMGWDDAPTIPNGFDPIPATVKRPHLGTISCGEPIMSEENFDGFDNVPVMFETCDFTLTCEGDSMIGARINDGDIVYIKQQTVVDNGQIAAVLIDGTDKLLKRVYISDDSIVLQAENPAYPPICFYKEDMNRVKIIGKAIGFSSVIR